MLIFLIRSIGLYFFEVSSEVQAQIRRIFFVGYCVWVVRIVSSDFNVKLQNGCLFANLHKHLRPEPKHIGMFDDGGAGGVLVDAIRVERLTPTMSPYTLPLPWSSLKGRIKYSSLSFLKRTRFQILRDIYHPKSPGMVLRGLNFSHFSRSKQWDCFTKLVKQQTPHSGA
ncbi:hypothetical protein Tco_1229799 [Tanacetum coccineum]